jgi:hypothetical protein
MVLQWFILYAETDFYLKMTVCSVFYKSSMYEKMNSLKTVPVLHLNKTCQNKYFFFSSEYVNLNSAKAFFKF